jgi:hypothetical protein
MGEQGYHESVRPLLDDDVFVELVLRPESLEALRAGIECQHVRLDAVAGQGNSYVMYVETTARRPSADAIPAEHAPHSPDFRRHRGLDPFDLVDGDA